MRNQFSKDRILEKRKVRFVAVSKGRQGGQPVFLAPVMPEGSRDYFTGSEYIPVEGGSKSAEANNARLEQILAVSRNHFLDPPKDSNDSKAEETKSVPIKHLTRLDLSKDLDAAIYNLAGISGLVAPSKAAVNPTVHYFYVEDKMEEAKVMKTTISLKQKAFKYVGQIKEADRSAFFRLIVGDDPNRYSILETETKLLEAADKTPQLVIKNFESDDIRNMLVVQKLLIGGVIRKDHTNRYKANDLSIGLTVEDILDFVKDEKNATLVTQWIKALKQ